MYHNNNNKINTLVKVYKDETNTHLDRERIYVKVEAVKHKILFIMFIKKTTI